MNSVSFVEVHREKRDRKKGSERKREGGCSFYVDFGSKPRLGGSTDENIGR